MMQLNLSVCPDKKSDLPIRVIQFGEGNFLRGFIDWMVYKLNSKGLFNGRILALQCTPRGRVVPKLKAQDGLYTTLLHGIDGGKSVEENEVVNSIAKAMNPYEEWQDILEYAKLESLQFVFSNTTEAGITYVKEDLKEGIAPSSYPGKLTVFLYERFKHAKSTCKCGYGMVVMPCELLDDNGKKLKNIVLQLAKDWNLGDEFISYLNEDCRFLNTLVDRVVSGYPVNEAQNYEEKLGYVDELMTCGELFHFMAIEGDNDVNDLLPFAKAGLNVVVAPDITPYRLRKVRILNGAHTANVPAAFLAGLSTVDEMMSDPVTGAFVHSVVYDEIIPAVNLDKTMLTEFADDVMNRFKDPSMHHQLASILMNSTSKLNARVIPSILDARAKGVLPKKLCFAVAAYIALYHDAEGVPVKVKRAGGKTGEFIDDVYAVEVLKKAWSVYQKNEASALFTVKTVLSDTKLWGINLSADVDLTSTIAKYTHAIITDGVVTTMQALLELN